MYSREQFAKMIDHSRLHPMTTRDEVLRSCDEARDRHFATVCVFPCWVGTAARRLEKSDVKVCTVVSFPFGADTRMAKAYAIKNAVANGATEIDAVMSLSKFRSGEFDAVASDLTDMMDAIKGSSALSDSRRVQLKVIIESGLLTDAEKELAARLVRDSGADFINTSTGTGPAGASTEDVRLLRRAIGPGVVGIKASGGIRTLEQAVTLLNAGCNRIGTSVGTALYDAYDAFIAEG